jgi:hypothetical protein
LSEIPTSTPTTQLSATSTLTAFPSSTTPKLPTATITPLPTLPVEEKNTKLIELSSLENCHLPCWFGITPGETSWDTANQILAPLSRSSRIYFDQNRIKSIMHFDLPDEVSDYGMRIEIEAFEGVIKHMGVFASIKPQFNIRDFLLEYGAPGQVWLWTMSSPPEFPRPFYVFLFYPDRGILLWFITDEVGDRDIVNWDICIKGCLTDVNPGRYLFIPNEYSSFMEVVEIFSFASETQLEYRPFKIMEETTDWDIDSFYDYFTQPDSDFCIITDFYQWEVETDK